MPHPTILDAGTYQPDLLRRGVQIVGLLRAMTHLLRKARGNVGHNAYVQVTPFADGPSFFKPPTQDLSAHQRMELALLGQQVQRVVDGVGARLLAHPANATGWFKPRFSLDQGNLQPVLYVPGMYGSVSAVESRMAIRLRSGGELGRALALSDLLLGCAGDGPVHRYVEKWNGWNTTGVNVYAPDPVTALSLVWAWRQPKAMVAALAGGTTDPLKAQVERLYGAQDWLDDRTNGRACA
jgi:hypothetical protein